MIQKNNFDNIVEEIHRIREEIADKFDGNTAAILEDARNRQAVSGHPIWKPKASSQSILSDDIDSVPVTE